MYIVSGSNIFTQWSLTGSVFPEFRRLLRSRCNFPINRAKLIFIHWSYNIFLIEGTFYITGTFYGNENIRILNLPEDCTSENAIVAGNDYKIVVIRRNTTTYWVINLENMEQREKKELCIERPVEDNAKKMKLNDHIIKISLLNDSCLFLTECGYVYAGILGSYVDTSHCVGKVVDIASGYEHFMLLTDAGKVYTWGEGGYVK
ncbi:hypothetical protein O3G_MSEX010006 [Manduca sexta]|uniref:Uncharacterized protein n=1 Tax=Manduca sexta TaxID=7130 RepID=A0A922CSM2_MANSE|nr:hypothetical protein O3G_MSEX010006 [Manduca sexta]